MGSPYQPTFEKGETSGFSWVGPGYVDSGPMLIAEQLPTRPIKLNPVEVVTPLTLKHSGSHEENMWGTGAIARDLDWFV